MRVLVGPGACESPEPAVAAICGALAGPQGSVVFLPDIGVKNLSRPLSAAEVALLRGAMAGEAAVGYVCQGRLAATAAEVRPGSDRATRAVIVEDHADLTWRSPLTGPNDDSVGPRFPSMTGIYVPGTALDSVRALEGIIVESGVVAGVCDHARLSVFETDVVQTQGHVAVSSELAPVVTVAAHMGLKVAAVIVAVQPEEEGDG